MHAMIMCSCAVFRAYSCCSNACDVNHCSVLQTSFHRSDHHQAEPSGRATGRHKNVAAAEKITIKDTTSMFAKYMHMHADAGYLAIIDADSSAFANALSQHDQFANVDVNAMLSSQGDTMDTYEEMVWLFGIECIACAIAVRLQRKLCFTFYGSIFWQSELT
jgi:predicted transposase YbfD/YdcC